MIGPFPSAYCICTRKSEGVTASTSRGFYLLLIRPGEDENDGEEQQDEVDEEGDSVHDRGEDDPFLGVCPLSGGARAAGCGGGRLTGLTLR